MTASVLTPTAANSHDVDETRHEKTFQDGTGDESTIDPSRSVSQSEIEWDPVVEAKARRK